MKEQRGERAEGGQKEKVPTGADRRRHQRLRLGILTEIESEVKGVIPGITYNVSESGAMVLTLASLEPGDEVRVCFLSDTHRHKVVLGKVVHVEEMTHHVYWRQKVGIEFSGAVPEVLKKELHTARFRTQK